MANDTIPEPARVFDWLDVRYTRNGDITLMARLIEETGRKEIKHSVFIPRGSKPAGVAISLRRLADLIDGSSK